MTCRCECGALPFCQPSLNLRQPLLKVPDLPIKALPARLVPGRRGGQLGLMGGDLRGQLGALTLKGLPLVKGPRHASEPTFSISTLNALSHNRVIPA